MASFSVIFRKAESITSLSKCSFWENYQLFKQIKFFKIKYDRQNEHSFPFSFPLSLNSGLYPARISIDDFLKELTPDNSKAASSLIQNRLKIIFPDFEGVSHASSDGSIKTTRFCIFFDMAIQKISKFSDVILRLVVIL